MKNGGSHFSSFSREWDGSAAISTARYSHSIMHILLADYQIDAGDGQHDDEQNDSGS